MTLSPSKLLALGRSLETNLPDYLSQRLITNKAIQRFLVGVRKKRDLMKARLGQLDETRANDSKKILYTFQGHLDAFQLTQQPEMDAEALVLVDVLVCTCFPSICGGLDFISLLSPSNTLIASYPPLGTRRLSSPSSCST